jgi:pimeloyl-ACP methyl ester carboxylesterase
MKTQKQLKTILSTTLLVAILLLNLAKAETISFGSFDATVIGKGEPIILIHGYASDKSVWDETVDYLKSDYQCHVIQLAGFAGKDPIITEKYLSKFKDDMAEYIKNVNLEKVIVMGHSMGGFLALWLASEYPDLVSKVVSVDGVPFISAIYNTDATPESQMSFAKESFHYDNDFIPSGDAMTDEQLRQMFTAMTIHEDKISVLLEWTKKSDVRTLNQTMFELMTTDIRENLKQIKVPVLVLGAWIAYKGYGATRESTFKLYELQYENVNNCTIKLTNKGKHFIMWDDFEWYLSTIKEFLLK